MTLKSRLSRRLPGRRSAWGSTSRFWPTSSLPRLRPGSARLMRAWRSCQVIGAQEARDLGIVHAIHDEDALDAEASALATRLAEGPTRAFGLGKAMLNRGMDCDFATYLEIEATAEAHIMQTEDHHEAVAAFKEKRQPRFCGS